MATKTVTLTLNVSAEVDEVTALIIKDRIKAGSDDTFISENVSFFDFDPGTVVQEVTVE